MMQKKNDRSILQHFPNQRQRKPVTKAGFGSFLGKTPSFGQLQ